MINQLNNCFTKVETALNIGASVPVLGIIPAGLRMIAGKVQFVTAFIFACVGGVGQVFDKDKKWEVMKRAGMDNMLHGVANVIRGFGEQLAHISIIGSWIPLAINLMKKPAFTPFLIYGSNQQEPPVPVIA